MLLDHPPRFWKGRVGVRVVRGPHDLVDPQHVTQPDTRLVFLEGVIDLTVPENLARPVLDWEFEIGFAGFHYMVEALDEIGNPADAALGNYNLQVGMTLKQPAENKSGQIAGDAHRSQCHGHA